MTSPTRIARAAACAALLAIPAVGLGAEATIRIEGTSATVLPETAYVLPAAGTTLTIRDTGDGDVMSVGGRTAAAQLGNASRLYGVGFGFTDWGQWGFALDSIGGDPSDWNNGPAWFVKHNHRMAALGAGSLELSDGDEVLWALSPFDGNFDMALDELALSAPDAPMVSGQRFQVRVDAYDNAGVRTPASGTTLTYRGSSATTGADGTATLTSSGVGPADLVATRAGAVRDSARVCAHAADDPTTCNLPPLPKASMPPDPATADGASATTVRVPVAVRAGGAEVTVTAEVPVPTPGGAPVAIRRGMIRGADLSPAEMRRAMGAVASAVAAHLNARAARGDGTLSLPRGATWRAAWLSGTPFVAPLRAAEGMLGIRTGGPRNTSAIRERARGFARHLDRCDIDGSAAITRRHGYVMVTLQPASSREQLVRCVTRTRS